MAYSSENSCKKGCSCDSCKGGHKSIRSEAFTDKIKGLVDKTKEAGNKMKTAATLGLGDTHGQDWTSTSNLSGTFPGAGTAAAAAFNIGKRTIDVFRESSEYIGSQEHYNDLVGRHKEDMENFEKQKDPYARQHLQRIARKSFENVQNHPLHSKIVTKKETNMIKESHFIVGDTLQNNTKQTMQGVEPGVPHKVVKVGQSGGPFSVVTYHLKNTKTGQVHPFANAHMLLKKLDEELKTVDDVTKTLPRGIVKKGPGEVYGDVEKSAPDVKQNEKTGIVAGKTGEGYNKMSDKYAKLAEAAFGLLSKDNQFRSVTLNTEAEHLDEGDVIQFPKKPKPSPTSPRRVITTASLRSPGPRPTQGSSATRPRLPRPDGPVKENLNQRFPDVENDIISIMRESNHKRKLLEQAENIYITTPEQRQDWLEVNRGAMDVLDYINKYKV
jgi:hypothetical protein